MNNRATGVLVVHSAPRALCSHIEWALNALVGVPLKFRWRDQPVSRDCVRAEVFWDAPTGSGARIASELRGWVDTRFEVTEDPSYGGLGNRFSYTPTLGLFGAEIDAAGNTMLTEARIGSLLTDAGNDVSSVRDLFDRALGGPWDRELEPYRAAIYDPSIRLLHGAG
ncbi:MAG: hypothetical protein RLZZ600_72 [Actinomycetota bacterium]